MKAIADFSETAERRAGDDSSPDEGLSLSEDEDCAESGGDSVLQRESIREAAGLSPGDDLDLDDLGWLVQHEMMTNDTIPKRPRRRQVYQRFSDSLQVFC
jgi:hypothetical protein